MKINFLIQQFKLAGGILILINYANHLSLLGHDVNIITVNPVKWRRLLANLLNYKPYWTRNFNFNIKRIPEFKEKYFPKADILVFSSSTHAKIVENYSNQVGKKVYFVQHDERLYHGDPKDVAYTYNLEYRYITVSTWLKEMLKDEFGKESELLLNPLDKNIFKSVDSENRDKIRILMLHHTYNWKGTEEGVKIIKELKQKYKNIELVMYGARKEDVECDEYHYQPYGEETARIFNSCDIFLCPSWDEGFGLPSLEAMACGCALVTYNNGGSRDFAIHNETAIVAKRKDINDLREKLELLVKDKDLRRKISKNGVEFIKKWQSWEEQAKQLEKIIETL